MAGKPPIRVPLAAPYMNREEAAAGASHLTTDTYYTNCFIETQPDGRRLVIKRPGMAVAYTYAGTWGQGTAYYQAMPWAMGGNVLYNLAATGNGSANGTAWAAGTSATWVARTQQGFSIFNGQVMILGGINSTGAFNLNDVWSSTDLVHWTQISSAAPWPARRTFGTAVLGNNLYVLGGVGAATYNDVWSTSDGVNWNQLTSNAPWPARNSFGAVAFNGGIMIMGGRDASLNLLNDVWFTSDGVTWVQLVQNASWTARQRFACLVFGGKVWVVGGIDGTGTVASIYSSPDGITWTNTGSLPVALRDTLATVYAGKMWFIGGVNAAAATVSTVYATADGASFTTPTSVYGGGAISSGAVVVWGDSASSIKAPTIWLLGGTVSGTESNQVYKATLNVAIAATYTPTGTGAATNEQWDKVTQNAGAYLIWKNTKDAWVYYAGVLQKITSTNYPTSTVRGIANLDDTVYVMDVNGVIYGSNLSDPFTWSALNFITADYASDAGVRLVKYKNYIVALKSTTFQIFYDAGRYPGSPLLPAIQYNTKVGCISAAFVAEMMDTIVWVAIGEEGTPYVAVMDGTVPKKISTPAIDRILLNWTTALASPLDAGFGIRYIGHWVYVLIIGSLGISIAYDFDENQWWFIKTAGSTFNSVNPFTDGSFYYLQDSQGTDIYKINPGSYSDAGGIPITSIIQTEKVDGGNNNRKFTGKLTVIGDRKATTSPNNLTVQWSDDDAQTFNTGQTVDLTLARPKVNRNGSFRRRTWKLTHASINPMRLEALELDII